MVGHRTKHYQTKRVSRMYVCLTNSRRREQCRGQYIMAHKAEGLVVKFLRWVQELDDPDAPEVEVVPAAPIAREMLSSIRAELEEIPNTIQRLIQMAGRGLMAEDEYTKARQDVLRRKAALEGALAEEERDLAEATRGPEFRRTIRGVADLLDPGSASSHQEQKDALALLLEAVSIDKGGEVHARFRAPKGTRTSI